jgi:GNAT superfamily N-acetyltransferase
VEHVRPAAPADLARCAELLAAARQEANGSRGGLLLEALSTGRPTVDGWAADGQSRLLLVGIFADAIVGLATGPVAEEALPGGRRLGRVDFCYVEPGARQVGVGAALVEELLSWFAVHGCTDVDAPALPGDRDTKQLYETAGFKARLLVLHRPLR